MIPLPTLHPTPLAIALTAVLVCTLGGCALTAKGDPLAIRYFTPESSQLRESATPVAASPLMLMLGRVRASAYLRERIAFRPSANELGFYELQRWTERPESYLRRALATSLFEQRGLEPVVAGPGATLDVELVAFEETRAPTRVARLQVMYLLYGAGLPTIERTITIEQPIALTEDPTVGVVRALSAALDAGVARISDEVISHLQTGVARACNGSSGSDAACALQRASPWNAPTSNAN